VSEIFELLQRNSKISCTFAEIFFLNESMETLQLNIGKNQFVGLLQALSVPDKLEIYSVLKKSLLCDRMENVIDTFDAEEISMEDITETVEMVRQERYEKRKQYV
jgi:hypothetical protein